MREYSNKISLIRNGRGVYCLDTTMGCNSGMSATENGCYGDCYAARSAKTYGYDFSKTILRGFNDKNHQRQIVEAINKIRLPFVRIGCSGDPSEDWQHAISILKIIARCNKEIVIITRHWTVLTDEQLRYLSTINICINTSASALDNPSLLAHCLEQYQRVKPYCKSVLRIVSCDFNLNNEDGKRLALTQDQLFQNESTLDTVFRPSRRNRFITDGTINVKDEVFNGHKTLASKFNRKTYMGKCGACLEMCGVHITSDHIYPNKRLLIKQLTLF